MTRILIPSNNLDRLDRCLLSLGSYRRKAIILAGPEVQKGATSWSGATIVPQDESFCFSREINRGLELIGPGDDALILNSDLEMSHEAIDALIEAAERHQGKCILSPALMGRITIQGAWKRTDDLVPERGMKERRVQWIPFFCAYLPNEMRKVVRASKDQEYVVGGRDMDERFTGYGCDDDDYCYRARRAGIPVIVLPQVTVQHAWPVDHAQEKWRQSRRFGPSGLPMGMSIFTDKWGTCPAPEVVYPPAPVPEEVATRVAWAEKVYGWMGHDELTWLATQASKRQCVIELGSFRGRSAKALAATPGKLYCVDQFNHDNSEREFSRYLGSEIQAKKVEMVRCLTWQSERFFREHGIVPDMAFIDASHDWRSVREDIRMCRDLMNPGGLICGHDFNPAEFPGVCLAVREFFPNYELPVGSGGSIWAATL